LADLRATRGALRHAVRVYQDALRLATTPNGHPLPVAARALVGIGNLELEQSNLVSAEQHLEKSVKLSELWGNPDTHVLSHISLARLRQAQENPNDALAHLEEAGQIAQRSTVTASTQAMVAAFQMRAALANGDWQSALQVAEQRGLRGDGELSFLCEVEYIAYARVLLAQGEFVAAGTLLERLYQKTEQGNRRSRMIEIQILRALVSQAQGDISQAVTLLANALSIAEPESYMRVFIDEGAPMIELLRRAGSHGIAPRYVAKLLSAVAPDSTTKDRAAQPLIEPLSEREIEILGFIAAGLSNQAIAEKLVVAIGTVKAHTASIYRKLDVASRTQAVARARELNLI